MCVCAFDPERTRLRCHHCGSKMAQTMDLENSYTPRIESAVGTTLYLFSYLFNYPLQSMFWRLIGYLDQNQFKNSFLTCITDMMFFCRTRYYCLTFRADWLIFPDGFLCIEKPYAFYNGLLRFISAYRTTYQKVMGCGTFTIPPSLLQCKPSSLQTLFSAKPLLCSWAVA